MRFHAGAHVSPKFSPNGRYVAYVLYSRDPGARLIEVVSFPDAKKKWTISKPGASRLRWSRDGRELFYVAGEALMKVSVSTNGMDLAPGQPEALFHLARPSRRLLGLRLVRRLTRRTTVPGDRAAAY